MASFADVYVNDAFGTCHRSHTSTNAIVKEIDEFYKDHSEMLSTNGKRPHARSRLPETKQWVDNIERFYELNPRRRPRKKN